MKLIYCIHSVCNPGGMERVTLNKLDWFALHTDWELMLVTTDQHGREPFYKFPDKVRMEDMGINYSDDNGKNPVLKTFGYLRRRRMHRKALTSILLREKADVVVSLLPCESSFIPSIKDGSEKVLELHQGKWFRIQYARKGLLGLSDRIRFWTDEKMVRKFDRFIILTEEDRQDWGNLENIEVIPNAAKEAEAYTDSTPHRVIAVGRLDYQKGHDKLIKAWEIVCKETDLKDWHLDIYGQGEWKEMLQDMIDGLGLNERMTINPPTGNVWEEYSKSSIVAFTSNYEGFPMVMVEAMSSGVVPISFDCKCGPKDIIRDGVNGRLVSLGDVDGFAKALIEVMRNDTERKEMSEQAQKVASTYSTDRVMGIWNNLFTNIKSK